jgi:hypothetical protein
VLEDLALPPVGFEFLRIRPVGGFPTPMQPGSIPSAPPMHPQQLFLFVVMEVKLATVGVLHCFSNVAGEMDAGRGDVHCAIFVFDIHAALQGMLGALGLALVLDQMQDLVAVLREEVAGQINVTGRKLVVGCGGKPGTAPRGPVRVSAPNASARRGRLRRSQGTPWAPAASTGTLYASCSRSWIRRRA